MRKSGEPGAHHGAADPRGDGYHLWSQTWDRKLDDIFAIQDEIAADVVEQLKITLLRRGADDATNRTPRPTRCFLQARQLGASNGRRV